MNKDFDFGQFFSDIVNNQKYNTEMAEHKETLDKLYRQYTTYLNVVKKDYKVLRNDNGEHKIVMY